MGAYQARNFPRLPLQCLCPAPGLVLLSHGLGFRSEGRKASYLLLDEAQPGLQCGDERIGSTFIGCREFPEVLPRGVLACGVTAHPVNIESGASNPGFPAR